MVRISGSRGLATGLVIGLMALTLTIRAIPLVAQQDPSAAEASAEQKEPSTAEEPEAAKGDTPDEDDAHPFPRRLPAPSLGGGVAWINTAEPLDLRQLRGKFVLLDFWTYCCINCMHILPELKKLEAAFPNELVVIGVHSAKFSTEEESRNITEAVLRYEIEHPVVNDSKHAIWSNYHVASWPSLRVIDPEGNLVAGHSGEIGFEDLKAFLDQAIPYYRQRGLLNEKPLSFALEKDRAADTPLRFPGKVLADETGGRLFIADSNHNRIIVARQTGEVMATIGSGAQGHADGDFASVEFNHPQGMALLGEVLYVADTENHLLRKVDLVSRQVTTIAGLGHQGRNPWPGLDPAEIQAGGVLPDRFVGAPRETALNSPWDLWIHQQTLYIAMAGPHQIWTMPLDESTIGPVAGNGREDIVDGPPLPREPYAEGFASFAQPSGLASDGTSLFVADSEGSSIRKLSFDPSAAVETLVGTSNLPAGRLFTFGDADGPAREAQFQHPLGVVFHQDQLYVADTYNNKIKRIDIAKGEVRTVVGNGESGASDDPPKFDEPAGISAAGGNLFVADTNNHAIRVVDLTTAKVTTLVLAGLSAPALPVAAEAASEVDDTDEEIVEAKPLAEARVRARDGKLNLAVRLIWPAGWKTNDQAPMSYKVLSRSAVLDGAALDKRTSVSPPSNAFDVALPLAQPSGSGELRFVVRYFICQEGDSGLCKMGTVAFRVPFAVAEDAPRDEVPIAWEAN